MRWAHQDVISVGSILYGVVELLTLPQVNSAQLAPDKHKNSAVVRIFIAGLHAICEGRRMTTITKTRTTAALWGICA